MPRINESKKHGLIERETRFGDFTQKPMLENPPLTV